MKFKHVIASLSLAMFTAFGVAAGLSMKKEAKAVKADDPDDSMMTVLIDMGDAAGYDGFNSPEVHCKDASYDTLNKYQMLHQITGTIYGGSITYRSADQSINWLEFLFKQGSEDKFSTSMSINPSHGNVCRFAYNNSWSQDPDDGNRYEWTLTKESDWAKPRFQYYGTGDNNIQNCFLTPDVATKTYKATFEIVEEGFSQSDNGQIFFTGWSYGALRQGTIDSYLHDVSLNSFAFYSAGKYDLFLYDTYEDGGVFELKKYEESDSWIYYMTESNTATGDYIYSWGGSSQFGSFPGKAITSIGKVQEVTKGGLIRFQGYDRLIYKVPVKIGYPNGDTMFMFNNGTEYYKSAEREIEAEHAYWWTGEANHIAAQALNFLVSTVETYRTQIEDGSICSISKDNAIFIVNSYNAYTQAERETYIDGSTLFTWKDSKKVEEEKEYVTYRKIVEQLAVIAGIELEGSSLRFGGLDMTASGNVAIIVISVAATSALALTLLLVFKKRKHK